MDHDKSADNGPGTPAPTSAPAQRSPQSRTVLRVVFLVLVLLSIGGVAIMDFAERYALWYWLAMAPIFGGASVGLAWQRTARNSEESAAHFLRRQVLHWGVLVLAILLVFLQQSTEALTPATSGLFALLLLAVATLLAGVHFEWRMAILGAVLAVTFAAAALAEEFFWAILVMAVIAYVVILFLKRSPRTDTSS